MNALKICGIRSQAMLNTCYSNNIHYVGINFVPNSRRKFQQNFELSSHPNTKKVGVFQNQSPQFIRRQTKIHQLDVIQLHGNETPAYAQQFSIPVIKAIGLQCEQSLDLIPSYIGKVDTILFDNFKAGSGKTVHHSLLNQAVTLCKKHSQKFAIAGGINAHNINTFIQKYPQASFFDTASGVENQDGNFCPHILHNLINASS